MSKKNNILLISNSEKLLESLASKVILLRSTDNVVVSDYKNAIRNFHIAFPDIVIINEALSKDLTTGLISELKQLKPDISIILLVDSYDPQFILKCYDIGINDFCSSNVENFELVIRVINNIKMSSVRIGAARNTKLLTQLNIIDEVTGFYGYKFCKEIFDNETTDRMLDEGTFMVLAPAEESKTNFSYDKMCKAIKESIREDDITSSGKGPRFYLLLPKTNFEGAFCVINKIKEAYSEDFIIKAGISSIYGKTFDEMETETSKALTEALLSKNEYVIVENNEETLEDWLDAPEDGQKNYKIFKQIFSKKMEKVIAPVFFRLQKSYEEKLFNTKIEQYTDNEQCVFHLKNKKQSSTLKIIYPGFAKILVYITHEGLDSPENREISLSLTKITQKELIQIVEDFIKEFKMTSI